MFFYCTNQSFATAKLCTRIWFSNARRRARKAIPFCNSVVCFIITTMKFNKCFLNAHTKNGWTRRRLGFLRVIFLTRGGWVGDFTKLESSRNVQSLHIQNTKGMKAPMATKIGNMAEDSSSAYGSTARGPLGFRFLPDWESVIWSLIVSSSVSLGSGGSVGQSIKG